MTKYGVLFVDDEPNVLRGLKRFCRAQRDEWDMYFADGGEAALEVLEQHRIDVVVSDMRMPGVNGADLFEEISTRWPGIIRIMLSGEAEFDQTIRTVGRSHRFLAKPCDPQGLIDAIKIPLQKLERFGLGPLAMEASFMDRLRTPPQVFEALTNLLELPDASTEDIAQVIRLDASLSMRVLQLVNSAYFGRPIKTLDIVKAVEVLGSERIRTLLQTQRLGNHDVENAESVATLVASVSATCLANLCQKLAQSEYATKDVIDLTYAASLFASLGAESWEKDQVNAGADPISAYMAALLGLPEPLTSALENLSQLDADTSQTSDRARMIFETVRSSEDKVA